MDKREVLWSLFSKTGKIEYYLKYKEEIKKDESRGRK
jgi:hypothetical protein